LSIADKAFVAVLVVVFFGGPIAFVWSWVDFGRTSFTNRSWRSWVSLVVLVLVSVEVALWVGVYVYVKAHYDTRPMYENGQYWDMFTVWWRWGRPAFLSSLALALLSLFGRPRCIAPNLIACLGAAAWWYVPYMLR